MAKHAESANRNQNRDTFSLNDTDGEEVCLALRWTFKVDSDPGMAAVRSSPRLRALLFSSNPSGKPAVFAPRLNRLGTTSDRTLRSKTSKTSPLKDSESSSPTKLPRGKKPSEKRSVVTKVRSKGVRGKGGVSDNALVGKRRRSDSSEKIPRSFTTKSVAKVQIGASKRSKSGRMLGRDEARSVEVATRCKQRKSSRGLASSANSPVKKLEHDIMDSIRGSGDNDISTSVNVKRKRGRPPKNAGSCKRVKITPTVTKKPEIGGENQKKVVIDLTCDNEAIGEEDIDSEPSITPLAPSSLPDLHLSQTTSTDSLACSPETDVRDIDRGEETLTDTENESDYHMTSLDPDETIAQLFDLGVKEESHTTSTNSSSESDTVTVPSLKRSKNISLAIMDNIIANSQPTLEINSSSSDDTPDTLHSPTEEEYPQPSTPQQKLIRRLARQKQLEEMKSREAALEREERLLRRKGVLPDSKTTQGQSSAKRISWRDETDLVEMFIYSPVRDDDADTVSVHSDDASSIELAPPAT